MFITTKLYNKAKEVIRINYPILSIPDTLSTIQLLVSIIKIKNRRRMYIYVYKGKKLIYNMNKYKKDI